MDRQKTFQQGIHASLHAMHMMLVTAVRDTHTACRDIAQGEQNAAIGAIITVPDLLDQLMALHKAILAMHRYRL